MFNSVDSVLSLIDAWIQGTEKKLEGVIIAANCKETPVTFDSVLSNVTLASTYNVELSTLKTLKLAIEMGEDDPNECKGS